LDPRLIDITLTGYRDTIDYLGYYQYMLSSMIDVVGTAHHLGRVVFADRAVKVKAVRISCISDQARAKLFPRRTSRVTTPSRSLTPLAGLGLLRHMEAVGKPKVAVLVMVMTLNTNPDPSRTTET
jgi:hypothetical protein